MALLAAFTGLANAQSPELVLRGRALPETTPDFCYDVNRAWVESTPIPSSYPWNSEYVESHDVVSRRLHEILRSRSAPVDVARFLTSYENTAERERVGLQPLQPDLKAIEKLRTRADLARVIARFNRSHRDPVSGLGSPTPAPFYTEVRADPADARRQMIHLLQGGLGLPGSSYYRNGQAALREVRVRYRKHIAHVLDLAGTPEAERAATHVLEIESALAGFQSDLVQLQGAEQRTRRFTLRQLEQFAPDFDWSTFFQQARIDSNDEILVPQAQFIRSATELMSKQNKEELRAYFRWQLLRRYSVFLSTAHADANFDFVGRTLQGAQGAPDTARMAEEYAAIYLPDELSSAYVKRYVTPASRRKARDIAETVRAAYRDRIGSALWLSERSRAEAQRKLDTLQVGMLYPDGLLRPSELTLRESDLIGNVVKLNERRYDEALRRLRQPTDRLKWWDPPISISGSYSASTNALIITAGRALPPLFDPEADDPENYGGLGTLVGHELGHALDNQGSQYDADGNHRDWWSAEDKREFDRRSMQLVEQYGKYEPLPGMHLNARAELSENIGDLVGLGIGYDALARARRAAGRMLTTDDERRFFKAWATRWRTQYARPFLVRILTSDTHPPLQYRCTVPLSNFTRFYDVVGIDPKSTAYVAPAGRVSIW